MASFLESPASPPMLLRSGGALSEAGPSGLKQGSVGGSSNQSPPIGSQILGLPVARPRSVSRSNGALPDLPPGRSEPLFQNVGRDLGRPLGFNRRIPVMPPPPQFSDGLSDLLGLERQPSSSQPPVSSAPANSPGEPDTPASKNTQIAESPIADKPFERMDGKLDQAAVLNPGPPTMKPVDEFDIYRKLEFDPSGPTEGQVIATFGLSAITVSNLADDADDATVKHFKNMTTIDSKADAFRHTLFSYELSKRFGAHQAKRLMDAHEISFENHPGGRLMDLFNNNVGRRLALDPKNRNRDGETVVLEALKRGELQTELFRVIPVPSRLRRQPLSPAQRSG